MGSRVNTGTVGKKAATELLSGKRGEALAYDVLAANPGDAANSAGMALTSAELQKFLDSATTTVQAPTVVQAEGPAFIEPTPIAGEFRVNTFTTGSQDYSAVTALDGGGFLVTWSSDGQDGDSYGIYGQRYTAAGVANGSEFRINTFTAGVQIYASASALIGGGFVVTWSSNEQDGSDYGIYGQRYTAAGVADGGEFRVNTFTTNNQIFSAVTTLTGGGFVVTWTSGFQDDGSSDGIYGRRYTAAGVADGGEFRVNTFTAGGQYFSAVAALDNGGFVVTWTSSSQDGSAEGVYAQRYTSAGVADGSEFRVNTFTTNSQAFSSVAGLDGGGFVVTWSDGIQDGSGYGVYGQRYTAAGVADGGEFRINTNTNSEQFFSSVTALNGGGFLVTWSSLSQDGDSWGIYGQRYTASGIADGGEFRVSETTVGDQLNDAFPHQAVTQLADGSLVATWFGNGIGDGAGVFARRFALSSPTAAPAGTDATLTINEDTARVLTVADFGFTDTDGNALLSVGITTLPAAGTIRLNGVAVTAGTFVTATDINAGLLVYTPAINGNGPGYSSFTFQVRDNSGSTDTDTSANTLTSNVTAVNDAPTFSAASALTRVSGLSDGSNANAAIRFEAGDISADGTKVLFSSNATNLVAGDTNAATDIFLKDLATGTVTRISTSATGIEGNGTSSDAMLSPDGTKVIFTSTASNLVAGDTNGTSDVFVKTLATGAIERISVSASGFTLNNGGTNGIFSPDGTKVAFQANNQIYVKTLSTGVLQLVSTDALGNQGNSASGAVVFSPDGTKIAFSSIATNLVAGDTNGQQDIFVKDLVTGVVTLVSVATDGSQATGGSFESSFSPDGTKIVFRSIANNLSAADGDGTFDIFVRDLVANTTTLVSADASGIGANGGSQNLTTRAFSADGSTVYFASSATNLVAGTFGVISIFGKNLATGAVTLISVREDGTPAISNNFDAITSATGAVLFRTDFRLVAGDTDNFYDQYLINPGNLPPTYRENGAALTVVGAVNVADVDSATYAGGIFSASITTNSAAGDQLTFASSGGATGINVVGNSVQFNGVEIGILTASATTLSVALDSDATDVSVKALAEAVRFASTSENPSSATRTVTFTLVDGGGTANGGTDAASFIRTVAVTSVNDAPSGMDAIISGTEDVARTLTATDFGFTDTDGNTLFSVIISTLPAAGTLRLNGNAVTVGQAITVGQLNDNLLVYTPAANANGDGVAALTFRVRDNGGTANGGIDTDPSANTLTFNVMAIDDAPVAVADSATTPENAAVIIDVTGNDTDIDGGPRTVTQINGVAATVGTAITLGSGATATNNGDGTITYNPNGAFDSLPGASSGASNLSAPDSFTYTLNGGNSATVSLTVTGVDSNDTLNGTAGNDTLDGGAGSDILNGFGGDDTLRIAGGTTSANTPSETVNGGTGEDHLIADYSTLTEQLGWYVQVEDANGSSGFADIPNGTRRVNFNNIEQLTITSGSGNDVINGTAGNDSITTGAGNDLLISGVGNDVLSGGADNDILNGGANGDTLTGGAGNDTFVYQNVTDSNSTERDGIQDFALGDIIDLTAIDANSNVGGNQDFRLIGTNAFSSNAGELRYQNISGGGPIFLVQGDVDGDGMSDFEVVLVNTENRAFTEGDFLGLNTNDAPVAVDDALAATEDTAITYTAAQLTGNDTDADSDPLYISSVTAVSGGTVVLNGDGTVTFTPDANFNGDAVFDYTTADGNGGTDVGSATVAVAAVNDAPVVNITPFPIAPAFNQFTLNTTNAWNISGFVQAENFTLGNATTLNHLNVYLLDTGNGTATFDGFSGTLSFAIYANDGSGQPGTLLFTGADLAPLAIDTGVDAFGRDIYQFAVNLGGIALPAGNYWFALHEGTWLSPSDGSELFWMLSANDVTGIAHVSTTNETAPNGTYTAQPGGLSFSLNAPTEQVPYNLKGLVTVSDVDAGSGVITATLSVGYGVINVAAGTSGATVDSGNGTGSVVVSGTLAQLSALLNTDGTSVVTFTANTDTPPANTSFSVSVNDNGNTGGGGAQTGMASQTIVITAINDAPVADLNGAAAGIDTTGSYTEGDAAVTPIDGIVLSDPDNANLTGATVRIATGFVAGDILRLSGGLSGTTASGITFSYNSGTGVLTLSGSATVADYQAALATLAFKTNNDAPGTARDITVIVTDGTATSVAARINLTVIPTNDAPVVDLNGAAAGIDTTASYTEGGAPVSPIAGIVLSDVDSANLTGATVTVATGFVAGDILRLSGGLSGTTASGITFSYNSGTGVLTLSGSASVANYQAALVTLAFKSNGDDPGTARDITVVVNDGTSNSVAANITLTVSPVNDAPVADLNGAAAGIDTTASYTEGGAPVSPIAAIVLSDVDSANLAGATVTIATGFVAGDLLRLAGGFSGTTASGITFGYNNTTGVLTLSGVASVADYQAALATLSFKSNSDDPGTARDITVVVNDGTSNSVAANIALTVSPINDAPVNIVPVGQTTTSGDSIVFSAANGNALSVSDPDAGSGMIRVRLSVEHGTLILASTVGVTVTGDGTGVVKITGTLSAINAALNGLTYQGDAGYEGTDALAITTNDTGNTGSGGPLTDTDSVAITVDPAVSQAALSDKMFADDQESNISAAFAANDNNGDGGLDSIFYPAGPGSDLILGSSFLI